jgi:Lar family restriction alleviation protein
MEATVSDYYDAKPCPFCGGDATMHVSKVTALNFKTGQWRKRKTGCNIKCDDCGVNTGVRDTEVQALRAWNHRHAP